MMAVMLKPSMHEKIWARAAALGMTVSEYIRSLVAADLAKKGK